MDIKLLLYHILSLELFQDYRKITEKSIDLKPPKNVGGKRERKGKKQL